MVVVVKRSRHSWMRSEQAAHSYWYSEHLRMQSNYSVGILYFSLVSFASSQLAQQGQLHLTAAMKRAQESKSNLIAAFSLSTASRVFPRRAIYRMLCCTSSIATIRLPLLPIQCSITKLTAYERLQP